MPVRSMWSIPLRSPQLSPTGRAERARLAGSTGLISFHSASDKALRPMNDPQKLILDHNSGRLMRGMALHRPVASLRVRILMKLKEST